MKKVFALFAIAAVTVLAQSAPSFTVQQGTAAASTRPCNSSVNVGSIYTQIANPSITSVCSQTGNNALGAGAFGWVSVPKGGSGTGSFSIAAGKTFTVNNTLTLAGTDGTTMTFPATSATIARTDAANTFTGVQTMTSPVLITPTLGVATATTVNKVALTAPATGSTLTIADGKTLTASNTLTLAGTDGTTITFPSTSISVPGTVVSNCGTANACSATTISPTSKVVVGVTAALDGASPSVAAVTGMPAFTSSSSYTCTANANSAAATTVILAVNRVSSSAVTFTGPNGATDTVSYICIGS